MTSSASTSRLDPRSLQAYLWSLVRGCTASSRGSVATPGSYARKLRREGVAFRSLSMGCGNAAPPAFGFQIRMDGRYSPRGFCLVKTAWRVGGTEKMKGRKKGTESDCGRKFGEGDSLLCWGSALTNRRAPTVPGSARMDRDAFAYVPPSCIFKDSYLAEHNDPNHLAVSHFSNELLVLEPFCHEMPLEQANSPLGLRVSGYFCNHSFIYRIPDRTPTLLAACITTAAEALLHPFGMCRDSVSSALISRVSRIESLVASALKITAAVGGKVRDEHRGLHCRPARLLLGIFSLLISTCIGVGKHSPLRSQRISPTFVLVCWVGMYLTISPSPGLAGGPTSKKGTLHTIAYAHHAMTSLMLACLWAGYESAQPLGLHHPRGFHSLQSSISSIAPFKFKLGCVRHHQREATSISKFKKPLLAY
ncbi:hypothetical protein VP01_2134g1 [Puccinia sorghi]|uniref:Uncharacterized protein n=1 Tax=Puccinia sorghi TaxID=27349 RepID=A0A0L6V9Z0_9BASI|nr:hypothetical protein VP01_2134g1 [Puccinia sorghi]